ncbi:hypothetical protein COR50_06975 [Chitinophaga caeni]|uniref:Carboxypeptidase-like regulatory domain-containing protein n=1 Tax=Chitinophaga caeni TaxID=2029983 RepID=A0A291QSM6_9BACT|nr:carboxypeptidase-like regulatory domain-containing protein [Chitinophaga caeni]ATL46945.1 hypothetical protein COR50_06975 [Chitinophaga caeni]
MMKQIYLFFPGLISILLFVGMQQSVAQTVRINGMISDADTHVGLPGVSIWNKTSGAGTVSNETGRYFVEARPGDTIEFSMISYVRTQIVIPSVSSIMNIDLQKQIIGLQGVNIRGRIYSLDSARTRAEYDRYFNYKRPGALDVLKTLPSNPITALTYLVPSKARKRKEMFRGQLEYWEKEKYIDYRYNPEVVQKMTKLEGAELDTFMMKYRPSYQFLQTASEYDFLLFIKQSYAKYLSEKKADAITDSLKLGDSSRQGY